MKALAVVRDADGLVRHSTTDPWPVVVRYRAEKPRHARGRLPELLAANVGALRLARDAMPGERPEVLERHPGLMAWLEAEIARAGELVADGGAAGDDGAQGKARAGEDAGPEALNAQRVRFEPNDRETNVPVPLPQASTSASDQDDLSGGRAAA